MKLGGFALAALAACGGVHGDAFVLASGQDHPASLAIGADGIYFVDQVQAQGGGGAYEVLRVPDTGGAAQVVATAHVVIDVAADASGAYWLDAAPGSCTIYALAPGASTATAIGTTTSGIYCSFRNLALSADAVFVADDEGNLWRVPKNGSGAAVVGKTDTTAGAVAVDASGVWVATQHGAKHVSFDAEAGPELQFAMAPPDALVSDGGELYAMMAGTGMADGSILHVSTSSPVTTVASNITLPIAIQPANGALYFATNNEGAGVWTVPETGGDVVELAEGALPGGIAVDTGHVYWTDWQRGEVLSLPR